MYVQARSGSGAGKEGKHEDVVKILEAAQEARVSLSLSLFLSFFLLLSLSPPLAFPFSLSLRLSVCVCVVFVFESWSARAVVLQISRRLAEARGLPSLPSLLSHAHARTNTCCHFAQTFPSIN